MAPVHTVVVLLPAELSNPVMKTQKMSIKTESGGDVNLGWCQTGVRFHTFKFVDDSIEPVFLWILDLASVTSQVLNGQNCFLSSVFSLGISSLKH